MYSATTMFVMPNNGNNSSSSSTSSTSSTGSISSLSSSTALSWMDSIKYLSPESLADIIYRKKEKVLIIDSRSFLEYNTTHITEAVNVCCSKLVKRRLQHDKLSVRELLNSACMYVPDITCRIIVYDQCTTDIMRLSGDCFVMVLIKKLTKVYHHVSILRGGFLEFQASHPSLCDHPSATPTSPHHQQNRHHQSSTSSSTSSSSTINRSSTSTNHHHLTVTGGSTTTTSSSSSSTGGPPLTCMSQPCMPVANIGPTKVLPHLYLGSQHDALSQDTMRANDITYVLNVSTVCPMASFISDTHFLRIPVNDNYSDKLLPHFREAFTFLDKVREANGRVLIHCLAGISRSATLAIAYVMKTLNLSVDDAYRYIKDKRPTISPNFNFMGQLLEYEKQLKQEMAQTELSPDSASYKRQCLAELRSPTSPTVSMPKAYRNAPALVDSCAAQSPTTAFAKLSFAQAAAALPGVSVAQEPSDTNAFPQLPTTSLDQLKYTPCFAKDEAVKHLSAGGSGGGAPSPMTGVVGSGGTKRPRSTGGMRDMSLPVESRARANRTGETSLSGAGGTHVVMRHSSGVDQRPARRPNIRPNSIAFSSYPTFELPEVEESSKETDESPVKSAAPITTMQTIAATEMPPRLKALRPQNFGKPAWSASRKSPPDQLCIPCKLGPLAIPNPVNVRKSRSMEDIITTPEDDQAAATNSTATTTTTSNPNASSHSATTNVTTVDASEAFSPPSKLDTTKQPHRQSSGSISSSGSHNSLHGSLEMIQVS